MRICLIDNRSAGVLVPEAAGYVGELGPALAEDQRVTILTIEPGLRRLPGTTARVRRSLSQNQPEIVHLNNLTGLTLAGSPTPIADCSSPGVRAIFATTPPNLLPALRGGPGGASRGGRNLVERLEENDPLRRDHGWASRDRDDHRSSDGSLREAVVGFLSRSHAEVVL